MQLKAVCPKTHLKGFDCEVVRKSGSLLGNESLYETLFIDYYFQININCDGTNPLYPRIFTQVILLTQYTAHCHLKLRIEVPDVPVITIVFQPYESLGGIRVVEMDNLGQKNAVVILWIKNDRTGVTATQTWGLATAGKESFQALPLNRLI